MNNKLIAASAYLFGIPALYIVLTDNRKKEFVGYHGAQALYLWALCFIIFFTLRLLINLIWNFFYIPGLNYLEVVAAAVLGYYVLRCAYRAFYCDKR